MDKMIFMGQLDVVKSPGILRTTLGSCVGLVLFDARTGLYGLAHIVLPSSANHQVENPGKFADTAVPELLRIMGVTSRDASRLTAKVLGGANMFGKQAEKKIMNIGEQNVAAVRGILRGMSIKIAAEDVGGDKGRQVVVEAAANKVFVSIIGQEKIAV